MESTIYSRLGLPAPANAEALARCSAAIRDAGAVPAMVAVLGGRWQVGVTGADVERVLATDRKVAERDLAVVAAAGADGVTTVSATLAVAHLAGIAVFATGGIGGVHRQSEVSGDVSADLGAIARHPVITTCAGAKAFLDLPEDGRAPRHARRAAARLAPRLVPGLLHPLQRGARPAPRRVGRGGGGDLPPAPRRRDGHPADGADPGRRRARRRAPRRGVIADALAACAAAGVRGAAVTPFLLEHLEAATGGRSVQANLALAEHNASVAAAVAVASSPMRR